MLTTPKWCMVDHRRRAVMLGVLRNIPGIARPLELREDQCFQYPTEIIQSSGPAGLPPRQPQREHSRSLAIVTASRARWLGIARQPPPATCCPSLLEIPPSDDDHWAGSIAWEDTRTVISPSVPAIPKFDVIERNPITVSSGFSKTPSSPIHSVITQASGPRLPKYGPLWQVVSRSRDYSFRLHISARTAVKTVPIRPRFRPPHTECSTQLVLRTSSALYSATRRSSTIR
jgi:hypothetical protein